MALKESHIHKSDIFSHFCLQKRERISKRRLWKELLKLNKNRTLETLVGALEECVFLLFSGTAEQEHHCHGFGAMGHPS